MTDNMTVQDVPDSMNSPRRPNKKEDHIPPAGIGGNPSVDTNGDQMQSGSDTFVLNRGRGFNVVKDFNALEGDKIALPKGLSFEKLTLTQIGSDTLIQREHHKTGLLLGVQASSITADIFVKPPSLTAPISSAAPSSLPVA